MKDDLELMRLYEDLGNAITALRQIQFKIACHSTEVESGCVGAGILVGTRAESIKDLAKPDNELLGTHGEE